MDSSAYASLKQNLNNSAHVAGYVAPVRDEVTNDVAEAGRSAVETAGAFFSQHAIGKIFTAIAKTKGASSEEVEGLAQATARGDGRAIMGRGVDMVMGRARGAVQPRVMANGETPNAAYDPDTSIAAESEEAAVTTTNDVASSATTAGLEDTTSVANSGLGATEEVGLPQTLPTAAQPAAAATQDLTNAGEAASKLEGSAESGARAVVQSATEDVGEDVLSGVKTAAKLSAAEDVDPINIGITAALGIASIVGGLFIKSHHQQSVIPSPQPQTANYAVQVGI
jgi:hypothetical protein